MPDPIKVLPKPKFRVLGWHRVVRHGYIWYWVEVNGEPRRYRAQDLIGLSTLLQILPEIDHWRRTFPKSTSRKGGVDTRKAGSWFMTEAERVGWYDPPPDLRPGPKDTAVIVPIPQSPRPKKFRSGERPWRKGERIGA